MRIGRFEFGGKAAYGLVEGDVVWAANGCIFEKPAKGDLIGRVGQLRTLVPCEPTKILGLARNYRMAGRTPDEEPQFFFKAHSTLIGHDDPIVLPWMSKQVVHEPELAIVIGTRAKNVSVDRALGHVLGYTCANDVTARDYQQKDRLGTGRTKNFDTFCPLGPLIVTDLAPDNLAVCARINGRLGCSGRTSQLIWKVPELVSFLSCVMTLLPGDVILTAAPGIDALHPGDVAEVEIEGIGVLRNPVVASEDKPIRWRWS